MRLASPSRGSPNTMLRSSSRRRVMAVVFLAQQRQRAATNAAAAATTAGTKAASASISTSMAALSRSALSRLRVAELRTLAGDAGLSTSGLKADLVSRLLSEGGTESRKATAPSTAGGEQDGEVSPASTSSPSPTRPAPPPLPLPEPDAAASRTTGLAVTWLGTSSGAPTRSRNVSCVAVRGPRRTVLVDAGEGTARQLSELARKADRRGPAARSSSPLSSPIPLSNVGTILVTHLHGDHCFGLASTLAAVCGARSEAARAAAAASGKQLALPRVLVAGPPGVASLVLAPCVLRGGRGYDCPVLVAEFTTDPSRASPPATGLEAVDGGCEVRVATLPPDRTRAAEAALAARGGEARSLLSSEDDDASDGGERGRRSSGSLASSSSSSTPRRRTDQAEVHAVDVVRGLTWTIPSGKGVFFDGKGNGERRKTSGNDGADVDGDAFDDDVPITIVAAQLQHRVPCWGYALCEASAEAGKGDESGDEPTPTKGAVGGRKVVVLGDTCDSSAMTSVARGADLLSHEATFSARMFAKAKIAQHSTAAMAGAFAASCEARRLVLTHFSGRYPDAGGRGGSTPATPSDVGSDSLGEDVPAHALAALVSEARREISRRKGGGGGAEGVDVVAARDLMTVAVPPRGAANPSSPTSTAAATPSLSPAGRGRGS